jgi:2-(3-amino-3-carboxypropyl)histidine synthase
MELEEAIKRMKEIKVKRVFVQLPEGLKTKCLEIADILEKNQIEPIISLETTFGACDLRDEEALRLKCDAILHFGHNSFGFEYLKSKLPIFYVENFFDKDIKSFEKEFEKIEKYEKIALVYSVQYKKIFEKVREFLEKKGKIVYTFGNSQIIGCNYSNALALEKDCEIYLVISSGKFHGLGLALKTEKPVFVFDVEQEKIFEVSKEREKYRKIIAWNKKIFEESKRVGLLISWKKGQLKNFETIKRKIENMGKKVYVFAFDELNENMLEGLKIDCLVNLACPRISIDDLERFKIPIVLVESINKD